MNMKYEFHTYKCKTISFIHFVQVLLTRCRCNVRTIKNEKAKDEITQTLITKSIEMQTHMLTTQHERSILVNTAKSGKQR